MATKNYIGVAERGSEAWWMSFPALPGVTSGGGTLTELLRNAPDALATAIEAMQDDGTPVPPAMEDDPAALEFDRADYDDPVVTVVSVEVSGRAQRINVSMDEGLLARLDDLGARTRRTRSALLAQGARLMLAEGT